MELDTAKGMRDIMPREAQLREEVILQLKDVFRSYGFVPLETPLIERYDVLSAKFAAGEESDAMSETYRLKDNAERELGLRFDLTVPLSRFIGMNPTIKLPFKRYQIGRVFRDAPIKAGRYREFTQCDVDIIGAQSMLADATCILLAYDAYTKLGLDVTIRVNNRIFLFELLQSYDIKEEDCPSIIMSIDKLDKIGVEGVLKEIKTKGFDKNAVKKTVEKFFETQHESFEKQIKIFSQVIPNSKGLKQIKEVMQYCNKPQIIFDPTLARGLGYYTGTIFEVEGSNKKIGSLGGGGRYDELIASYLRSSNQKSNRQYPAVGISFGLDRIIEILKQENKKSDTRASCDIFLVSLGTMSETFAIAQKLRTQGIRVDIDMMNRNVGKNVKFALEYNIPFVGVIGENELKSGEVLVKNLLENSQETIALDKLATYIRR
ncbi:MAG: histidine--tRNA ligase [Candidatus Woesearchaeota archaeon]